MASPSRSSVESPAECRRRGEQLVEFGALDRRRPGQRADRAGGQRRAAGPAGWCRRCARPAPPAAPVSALPSPTTPPRADPLADRTGRVARRRRLQRAVDDHVDAAGRRRRRRAARRSAGVPTGLSASERGQRGRSSRPSADPAARRAGAGRRPRPAARRAARRSRRTACPASRPGRTPSAPRARRPRRPAAARRGHPARHRPMISPAHPVGVDPVGEVDRDDQPDQRKHAVQRDQPALAVQCRPKRGGRRRSRAITQASRARPQVRDLQPVHQQVVAVEREERVEVESALRYQAKESLNIHGASSGTARPTSWARAGQHQAGGRTGRRGQHPRPAPGHPARRWCRRTPTGCRSRPGSRRPVPVGRRAWSRARGRARGRPARAR